MREASGRSKFRAALDTLSSDGLWVKRASGARVRVGWVLIFTVVVSLPVLMVIFSTLVALRTTSVKDVWQRDPELAWQLVWLHSRVSIENLIASKPPPVQSDIPTLEISVPKNTLQEMHRAKLTGDPMLGHEPESDRPYKKAMYTDETGITQRAKIAYRGYLSMHHRPQKPSLRVKIKKDDISRGQRYVELHRPEDALGMRNQIIDRIAEGYGMMTAAPEPVRVFINNEYKGIYIRAYRPGEPLALLHDRMPGTFFKGDVLDEYGRASLWTDHTRWRIFGEGVEPDLTRCDEFLAMIGRQQATSEYVHRLFEYLDYDKAARFAALQILSGNAHTDDFHNQVLFFNSNLGKFEMVNWDPIVFEANADILLPVDMMVNPILVACYKSPQFVHSRNKAMYEMVNGPASAKAIAEHTHKEMSRLRPNLLGDMHMGTVAIGGVRYPRSVWDIDDEVQIILDWAVAKENQVREYLDACDLRVQQDSDDPGLTHVQVTGLVAASVSRRDGTAVEIYDSAGGQVDLLYPGLGEQLSPVSLVPKGVNYSAGITALPCVMNYTVKAPLSELTFTNDITGQVVQPNEIKFLAARPSHTLAPSLCHIPDGQHIELGPGVVEVNEDIRIDDAGSLVIKPGTTLRMAPGIGIYVRGDVQALGSADDPIIIEPSGDEPWASFGVAGKEQAIVKISHLRIHGGSIGEHEGTRFKGMLSAYNCKRIEMTDVAVGINLIGDDAVNLAQSEVFLQNCTFTGARSDALDLDMCTGLVKDCTFIQSGNDGLDMMGCTLMVEGSHFVGSGDKGMSVGEGTRVFVRDCQVERCVIGMEVKDASRVYASSIRFSENITGYHAYQKKWSYPGGGRAFLHGCTFEGSQEVDLDVDKRSILSLFRTSSSGVRKGESRITEVDEVPAGWSALKKELTTP